MDQRGRPALTGRQRIRLGAGLLAALGLALCFVFWSGDVAYAQERTPDQACRLCHANTNKILTLPSRETLDLNVDLTELEGSLHGTHAGSPVFCTDCHRNETLYRYPHEPNPAQNVRDFAAAVSENCSTCHTPIELHNPGHLQARDQSGLPTCTDCHGGHAVAAVDPQTDPVALCQSCHETFEDPHVGEVHAQLVASFGPDQDCQMCHGEIAQTEDAQCKACHGLLDGQLELGENEAINLHVEADLILGSVHGDRTVEGVTYTALQCTDCHTDLARYGFPHPRLTETTQRGLTVEMERICQDCHQEIYEKQQDGVHQRAIEEGNLEAATCADCHGNHDIQDPDEPRQRVSETCSKCHAAINEQYSQSVHGAALLGENNPDVPVCTDCHGVHDINSPITAEFRVHSPTVCGGCHANEEMMSKYGISTNVFNSYVADFHGTTVTLFEKTDPDHEVNKAVCYDCHGVHNILPATDENSQVIKANLLTTCQQCHPDANENFPASWTSHFEPSLEHNPLVYFVNLFYAILIPALVGGFGLYIMSDIGRRVADRVRRKKGEAA